MPRALALVLLGAAIVVALLVGAGAATGAGLVVYSRCEERHASTVAAAPTPASSAPAVAALVPIAAPPGSGVHLYEAQPWGGSAIALDAAHAVLVAARGRFESCRVVGRRTHASVLISVAPRTGEAVSWMPDPYTANDDAASRCLGALYKEASTDVRYGTNGGAFFLEADFDAS